MTEWSEHVKKYAKKYKMTYREASMSDKCKEAYQKKKMSPRRMKMSGPGGGGRKPVSRPGRGLREEGEEGEMPPVPASRRGLRGDILGTNPSIPPLGDSTPLHELPVEMIFMIQKYILNFENLRNWRNTSRLNRIHVDSDLKSIMKVFKKRYPEIYNDETPGMAEFKALSKPTWDEFSRVCVEAFSIGNRLISEAARNNQLESIENLIRAGISVNITNLRGVTPLIAACTFGHLEVVQLLLDREADIDKAGRYGITPLFMTCLVDRLEVVRLLLENEADMDQAADGGITPLHVACGKGHLEVVRLLVENGADVEKARNNGETPLFVACQEGHLEVVQLLVEKGADIDRATGDGDTPLSIARQQNHTEMVDLLEQNGARE